MSKELSQLAEKANLPQIFVDQLEAGQRLTMWANEVALIRAKVWDVYTDEQEDQDHFQLRLQIQGNTGEEKDNYPLVALPEDLKNASQLKGFWQIQGYVAVRASSLEPEVQAAFKKFARWTELNKETKQEEQSRPKLWFEAGSADCGLQLIPKVRVNQKTGEEELSFSGWAHRGLEWHGKGISSLKEYELDEFFTNNRGGRGGRGAQVIPPPKLQVPQGQGIPNIPNIPDSSEVPY